MSVACARYFATQHHLVSFINFVHGLASYTDEARRIAAEALAEYDQDEHGDKTEDIQDGARAEFGRYRALMLETTLTRSVDNFLSYISDVLAIVFRTRPEALRSREQVQVDFVLGYDTMDELIDRLQGSSRLPWRPRRSSSTSEKLHAYTPRLRRIAGEHACEGSPRPRVDRRALAGRRRRSAIDEIFAGRGTHPVPDRVPEPPGGWGVPFRQLAEAVGVPTETSEAHAHAAAVIDPILSGDIKQGTWDPDARASRDHA